MTALTIPVSIGPKVRTQSEYGRDGYHALVAKYGNAQVNRWRRNAGGRRRNRTLAEIQADPIQVRTGRPARRSDGALTAPATAALPRGGATK